MSKRKTYMEKHIDLVRKAKAEIVSFMQSKGLTSIDISNQYIYIYQFSAGGTTYHQPLVRSVSLVKDCNGDGHHLEFEADGVGFWYFNPFLWFEIHDAVVVNANYKNYKPQVIVYKED